MASLNEKIIGAIQRGVLIELPTHKDGKVVGSFPIFIVAEKFPIPEFMTFFQVKLRGMRTKPNVIIMQSGTMFEVYSVFEIHDDLSSEYLYEFPGILSERTAFSRTDREEELSRLARQECAIAYPGSDTNQRFLDLVGLVEFFSNEERIHKGYTKETEQMMDAETCFEPPH